MSSTEERLRRFFAERLVPAAEKLRRRGVRFLPLGLGHGDETWYRPPPEVPDFVELGDDGGERALRQLWQAQGLTELVELVPEILELARELELDEEQSADVSPFLYVMY